MSIDDWLRDTAIDPPCGPDLEYDEQFMALVSSAARKPEQQYGDTIIPAAEPDWEAVVEQATQLLQRSKDLRTTLLLTRALTRLKDVRGLAQGLELSRRLLEQHWDDVHPRLIYDGSPDPMFRSSALAALADPEGLLRDVRAATLFFTPAGAVTVRSAEATLKRETTGADGMTEAQLRKAAAETKGDSGPLTAVGEALDHCNAIATLAIERMGTDDAPDLAALRGLLQTIERLAPRGEVSDGSEATPGAAGNAGGRAGDEAPVSGALRDRQDALRALDAVCKFLERTEPSSPATLFIRRGQRLIGSGFLDIMRDMAPDSLGHIELIIGQRGSPAAAKKQEDE
jgi:type VI secretion system protein ImpA